MKNYYLIIFALFLLNLSCSTQETDNTPVTIVGNWKIVKIHYSDSGDYAFSICEEENKLVFNENLTAIATEPTDEIEEGVCVDEIENFSYSIENEKLIITNNNNYITEFNFELTETTLKYWRTSNSGRIFTITWERIL
jgi:hypothetical protein